MSEFFTPVELPPPCMKSSYTAKHLMLGSCFSEYIGNRMESLKFNTDINPFGIVFNPSSISQCIRRMISGVSFTESELFRHNGLWHSWLHHGKFSNPSMEEALVAINNRLTFSSDYLRKTDFLILTLGTAWVFELKSSGLTVSNCHKVPAAEFKRFRLTVGEIVAEMRETLEMLLELNPDIKIILTVSPVRHMKDGASGNQLSKSILLLAADALVNGFGPDRCSCFPSYEIMMDELRDYRYYTEDMVHPSPLAVGIIWKKFSNWLFDKEVTSLSEKVNTLVQARNHRPVHRNNPEYTHFIRTTLRQLEELAKNYPFLDFSDEITYFSGESENLDAKTAD
jgi:hypothetical protein